MLRPGFEGLTFLVSILVILNSLAAMTYNFFSQFYVYFVLYEQLKARED